MHRIFVNRIIAAATEGGTASNDQELLKRFASQRDAPAFELLVRRHSDSVWTACRTVTHSAVDAEDAFQATFLVLMRSADKVTGPSVAGWLHRVAVRVSQKMRRETRKVTFASEEQLSQISSPPVDGIRNDESTLIQMELAGLPERYRLPIILCELEGHTISNASQLLGWPQGTVASRLSRARALLGRRLRKRGISAPAVLIPALGLNVALISQTSAMASGIVPISPSVSLLVEGVELAMRIAKLKMVAMSIASLAVISLAGFGGYTVTAQQVNESKETKPAISLKPKWEVKEPKIVQVGDSITAFPELDTDSIQNMIANCPKMFGDPVKISPDDPPLRQLQIARLNLAIKELSLYKKASGDINPMTVTQIVKRIIAACDQVYSADELRPWYEERVRVAYSQEHVMEALVKSGSHSRKDFLIASSDRLEAEIALLKLMNEKQTRR